MNQKSSACNIKMDIGNYRKVRTVCKSCYHKIKRKHINNKTVIQNQQPNSYNNDDSDKKKRKVVNSVNENINKKKRKVVDSVIYNNRTPIKRFSNCGKTYLMNYILLQKQYPVYEITKSLNQYPNIKAQTSVEIQPLEKYENSTVVFNDMLLSKQESQLDLFFTRKVLKDHNSNRVNDLLIHNSIPITLHDNLLTYRDTGKVFELNGDILKKTNKNNRVDLTSLPEKKLIYDSAKEMNFDLKAQGRESTRDRTFIKILKSPSLIVSASGVSNAIFLSSNLDK